MNRLALWITAVSLVCCYTLVLFKAVGEYNLRFLLHSLRCWMSNALCVVLMLKDFAYCIKNSIPFHSLFSHQGKYLGVWATGEENLLELDLRKNVHGLRSEVDSSGSHLGRSLWLGIPLECSCGFSVSQAHAQTHTVSHARTRSPPIVIPKSLP